MTKELLEILQECKKGGIDKDLAIFQACEKGYFKYTVTKPDGLEHLFVFATSDNMYKSISVDHLIALPNLTYLSHGVYLDNVCLAEKTAQSGCDGFFSNPDVEQAKKNAEELSKLLKGFNDFNPLDHI
jgi:hypothetical protein